MHVLAEHILNNEAGEHPGLLARALAGDRTRPVAASNAHSQKESDGKEMLRQPTREICKCVKRRPRGSLTLRSMAWDLRRRLTVAARGPNS
jgi:hypothetical protein